MEQAQTSEGVGIFKRILSYAEQKLRLADVVQRIRDRRLKPRIPTSVVVRSLLVMFLARAGSLNAIEQTRRSKFWRRRIGADLPSADSLGRIAAEIKPDTARQTLSELYTRLKRNKALPAASHGLNALVVDGHESHATDRRHCEGCLQRTLKTAQGDRTQFYHRNVTAMLLGDPFPLLIDAEPIRAGEDEVGAALRLLKRVLKAYPRAFDVVLGDAMYADARIFNFLKDRGKDVLSVLKANNRGLLTDAEELFAHQAPQEIQRGRRRCDVWDLEGFTTFTKATWPVRVVRSRETSKVRRQLDGQIEENGSECIWVTTLSANRASTAAVVELGHRRWDIENQGFNEAVNRWHVDHVYKHHPNAILVLWLLAMVAINIFHVFYHRNLKPARRHKTSPLHVAKWLASEIYTELPGPLARSP